MNDSPHRRGHPEAGPVVLRSAANPTVRHLIRLRDNRARRKTGQIIVDGWRETGQAIAAGLTLVGLFVPESQPDPFTESDAQAGAASAHWMNHRDVRSKTFWVSDSIMEKIGYGQSARGVVATFERPDWNLDRLVLPENPLLLVLDRIEKPGNVGAVFRCADAAGVDAILLSDCQDRFNPNAIRNSLGGVFRVPSADADASTIADFLGSRDIEVVAARVQSSDLLWSRSWTGPVAVVLGNEADGLGGRWQTVGDRPVAGVRIPMAGEIDSLNVSVSAAVIAFEATRQRGLNRESKPLLPHDR